MDAATFILLRFEQGTVMFNEMMRAEIWLQDHLDSQQGIEDLASRLGYSTSQVRRRFKQCFGLSPSAYRDSLRLEKAARLLAFTPFSIQSIATRCGYRNHSAFSRAFQRYHNQTPRQYRQALRLKLHHNPFCQGHGGDPPHHEIRWAPARQALVTRLYRKERGHPLGVLRKWTQYAKGVESLPDRLRQGQTIALLHNIPLPSDMERIDVGPLVDRNEAPGIAIPASFRLLNLPAQQQASVELGSLEEIPDVVQYLVCECLPEQGLHASGDAVQVEWNEKGVLVRLPVQQA
ncbi:helix-turn-helix transcriptional regulator [Halomonas sp. MCCC 1A17488]|uniref:Helix-turn-helix transcriptional regulator n=1 Tax=Billgrantia sulfidoxydans TaxID=2733484 RepID=A0ABX7W4L0_9GAMM|nr:MULTISPECIES: AraC family transcriptional regulator [Halomonas]MCE8014955.1 helix-turn-helix transcriptional regulator [Halomonas sp. MCCC 1A17488]MCG3238288.1 helix-turn-helix transcriptional regulator [Halomonas sp. MCCC 1A17488]QPP47955.1 helix-turn-helix transcriptional regulator [Halomonas sp. SS10-MC5]QTP55264.1 helix-turn-helix transcriptional regulator [Halomonas sulfidoxydans]